MKCEFCKEDVTDKGLLITTEGVEKQWACTDCFVKALIDDRATIVHSWGFEKEEDEEEPVEVEDDKDDESTGG